MITRYKSRPITAADATMWDGANITEIQALCPQVQIPEHGTLLLIPTDEGPVDLAVSNFLLREQGTLKNRVLDADAFHALYMPQ